MKTLIILAVITSILLAYALKGREWLKSKSWAQPFYEWIEPYEIFLFRKSETVLFARTLQGLGAVLTGLTWLGSIDITPILPLVPEKHAGIVQAAYNFLPLVLNGLGAIVEWLRNRTTKPIELVAIPAKVVAENTELREVIEVADQAKAEAVQIAVETKAA